MATKARAPSSAPGSTPHSASRPNSLAARSATASATKAQVMLRLDVALGAVVEQARAVSTRGGGVGQVVGEHLVVVDAAGGGEPGDARRRRPAERGRGRRRRRRGPVAGHGPEATERPRSRSHPSGRSGQVSAGRREQVGAGEVLLQVRGAASVGCQVEALGQVAAERAAAASSVVARPRRPRRRPAGRGCGRGRSSSGRCVDVAGAQPATNERSILTSSMGRSRR